MAQRSARLEDHSRSHQLATPGIATSAAISLVPIARKKHTYKRSSLVEVPSTKADAELAGEASVNLERKSRFQGGRLRISRPVPPQSPDPNSPATSRRKGVISLVALAGLLCSGASSPTGCTQPSGGSIGPSNGQVIGAAVGVGAVIAAVVLVSVGVHNSHHTERLRILRLQRA
jgi:hypothetical protein